MNLSTILAKMFYWNCWFSSSKKMISIKSLRRKMYNPKYMIIYLYKQDNDLKYSLPNLITMEYHDFFLLKNSLNKKQHIILLNNVHDVSSLYNQLKEENYKISLINWKKYKSINDIIKSVLKIK